MYLKALFYSKLFPILLAFIVVGCATSGSSEKRESSASESYLEGTFALDQQKAPPNDIQSIRLHPKGQPGQAPIMELNTSQKLLLSFDYLGTQNRQFRVTVDHYSKSWNRSGIGPNTYLDSFSETTIQASKISFGQRPSYHHVEFSFPNNELRPAVSGNYLIKVYSTDDNSLLFSMPFFVTENEGQIETTVERLFAQRNDGRPLDQLFSTYHYPNFVEYPQFDLSMSFVPNQFWGRTKQVEFLDTITPSQLRGYIEHDNAFVGNYEFKHLDLQNFDGNGQQILEHQPGVTPPRVTLRRDVQNLDPSPNLSEATVNMGMPDDDRNSNYAQVEFRLQTDDSIPPSSKIYIVGHFNNWMINDLNRMSFDSDKQMWTGRALIKQGSYAYKYVLVRDNQIDDLTLDQGFLSAQQEYLTFIYFKDPHQNFDRLLKVDGIIQR
ncbi:type IX secretion system plug protein domain-containing protein [Aliifodinibius salipaludis]|uniref:type IX secretion system plug protein n=1 Tax=Fodinibius salipaludis TaxID=2032627 RepID=UPI001595FDF0|nr:type IX secretion system plug protein domain-containing protein [Aliifodinibius salipaludis]